MVTNAHLATFRANADFDLDEFLDHQQHSNEPMLFPLHASSIGRKSVWKILARRLSIIDRASINFLPDHLQSFVWEQLQASGKEMERMAKKSVEPKSFNEALANNERYLKVADLFVMAAFEDPKIVLEKDQEDVSRRTLHVDRIAREDRIAFWIACRDAESEQARLFETFRPESTRDASGGQDGAMAAPAPLRPAGDARGGVSEPSAF